MTKKQHRLADGPAQAGPFHRPPSVPTPAVMPNKAKGSAAIIAALLFSKSR
ncbi:hypothetical protein [Sphingomonas bacterium]|uniref:hypothetical protein n=1 Tax=Sphingomonas bacterium TaxID=1895847 RepID=UPI001576958A|nr:hypothetical protein [Sphingomonas bacterium]